MCGTLWVSQSGYHHSNLPTGTYGQSLAFSVENIIFYLEVTYFSNFYLLQKLFGGEIHCICDLDRLQNVPDSDRGCGEAFRHPLPAKDVRHYVHMPGVCIVE